VIRVLADVAALGTWASKKWSYCAGADMEERWVRRRQTIPRKS